MTKIIDCRGQHCSQPHARMSPISLPTMLCPKLLDDGCIPGATLRNQEYVGNHLHVDSGVDYNAKMLMCDAQSSWGILMGVRPERVEEALNLLHGHGLRYSMVIGEVFQGNNILIAK